MTEGLLEYGACARASPPACSSPLACVCAGLRPHDDPDVTKGLQIDIANTGWFDLGIVNGQTKLVPTVTFTLKNVSDQKLVVLQIQALFRRVNENDEWGNGFVTVVGSSKGSLPWRRRPAA